MILDDGRDDAETRESVDTELLLRLRSGDESAFVQIFSFFYAPLVRFAKRSVRYQDVAGDIVQDVFTTLWERRTVLTIRTSLATYLYGAVRNKTITYLRHESVVQKWSAGTVSEDIAIQSPATDADFDIGELSAVVESAVSGLPPRCQEIFRLYTDDQLQTGEIAAILEVAPSTVRVQLARAMTEVRRAVESYLAT